MRDLTLANASPLMILSTNASPGLKRGARGEYCRQGHRLSQVCRRCGGMQRESEETIQTIGPERDTRIILTRVLLVTSSLSPAFEWCNLPTANGPRVISLQLADYIGEGIEPE